MIKKLRIKFICVNMAIVFIMLSLIFAAVIFSTQQAIDRQSADFMRKVASGAVDNDFPMEPRGIRLPFFAVRVERDGGYRVEDGGSFNVTDMESIEDIMDASLARPGGSGLLPQYRLRYYKSDTPDVSRVVFTDASGELNAMDSIVRLGLIIGGASLAVFFLISLALSSWAIRPVAAGWEQQRRFVSDASHELKTPLTLIALNAELMAEEEVCRSAPLSQRLENIQKGTAYMRSLAEDLLDLARADNGISKKQFTAVDLSRLTELSASSFEALFLEKGQRLTTDLAPGVTVNGSRLHLEQLLSILLDNANKYGAPGGAVTVSLKKTARRCQLCVGNTGEEIPASELKRVFERFYRLDEARSTHGSYGLGLSIASAVTAAHKGKLWAESGGGENRFYVSLPIKKQAASHPLTPA